ncbi:MAG: hypothetical protein HFE63_07665 [Clostridiales bacterium]|nr:hypothetical protein [Clostridiales bacterium]
MLVLVCACKDTAGDTPVEVELPDFSQYVIVRSDYSTSDEAALSVTLKKHFSSYSGIELKLATDWDTDSSTAQACEILMGKTNRSEYDQFVSMLKNPEESCAFGMVGEKLIFYAATIEGMQEIVDKFAADILGSGSPSPLTDGSVYEYTYSKILKQVNGEEPMSILKDTILWGINGHHKGFPVYSETYQEEHIRLAAELGSKIYRINYNPTNDEMLVYINKIIDRCHEYGMQVMLVLDHFEETPEEIAKRMTFVAENLADKVEYVQIFNETDIWCSKTDNGGYYNITNWTGMTQEYYNPERVAISVERMRAALTAFRNAAPDAELVVNIGSRHYPMLDWYIEAGLEWDIIAFDIYDLNTWDHAEFFHEMEERYPGYRFMVAECNYPANNGPFTDEQQAQWLTSFIKMMNDYDSERLIAVIVYELMDQPNYEKDCKYNGEAHFGLVNTNPDYSPGEPKPSYRAVQKLFCGGEAKLVSEFKIVE